MFSIFSTISIFLAFADATYSQPPIVNLNGTCNILALSGGGSFGMVEVGILSSLYENNAIPSDFDVISGISAGGLNAGFLSYFNDTEQGISELYNVYANMQNDDVYKLDLLGILENWSIYSTKPLHDTLSGVIDNKTPDTIHTPFTIVGTSNVEKEHLDIYHFNELNNVDKVSLLLSTSAIPVVFPPQHFRGQLYVDGGVISNEIIYQSLQYVSCDFYNVLFISASEHKEQNVKVDGLFSYLSSVVKLLYHTFNYQISEITHNTCANPIGKLTTCFPNSTELDTYSILDFNNGKTLFQLAKENNYCNEYPLC